MADPFLAEIRMWGCNYAPRGWAFCDGQLMSIAQNTALFSLLGTNFGGNGTTIFGLPDFRERVPVGVGTGPGLTTRNVGDMDGEASVTLTNDQVPPHGHGIKAVAAPGTSNVPGPTYSLSGGDGIKCYTAAAPAPGFALNPNAVSTFTGGGQAHENRMPFVGVNFTIALAGMFPPRP